MNDSKIEQDELLRGFAFRTTFVFLLLLTIPLTGTYYRQLFKTDWSHFQDVFQAANYVPKFFIGSDWGFGSFYGWGIALIISLIAAYFWGFLVKDINQKEPELYYWLRVIVRFRLAIALLSYGIIKIFPVQLPGPTLSDLHTAYGDFLPWKLYYLSTGVASAYYEQSLGAIEFLAGLLLMFRRTTIIGAGLATALLVNIVLINYAYHLSDQLYSVYLLILSVFLLLYDTPRLYNLLVKERRAKPDEFNPAYKPKLKLPLKFAVIVFAIFFSTITYANYRNSNWPYPNTPGLAKAAGFYNVESFQWNGEQKPYSLTDSLRWVDVVFEKWNVLSIRKNINAPINPVSPSLTFQKNGLGDYESKGNAGRFFYTYILSGSKLKLTNNNDPTDTLQLSISRTDNDIILLNGVDAKHDSLKVSLKKLPKEYLLQKGRRKKVSVY
ncbi:beta-carotene 15,15'-monooxygenase [Pedobacter sp. G11]|uniref:beta-carotene 15,15'-monooxygenase n=1 Tax=Pedobacter sp. G11 TaxID=2482728 RepID=UPI000F5E0DAD|nr:beta-carotene 15,15'-monooxygenase [Pedobacter sp. G11]AZI23826.1 beta-carotene 15,15'-monooxygenase [Pedobacter sp. G11]